MQGLWTADGTVSDMEGQSVYNVYGLNANLDQYCSFNIAEG